MLPTRGILALAPFTRAPRKDGLELLKSGIFCEQFTQNLPMPTYTKVSKGVRVQICVKRIRRSKTLPTMGAARAWGISQENEILAGDRGEIPNILFEVALDRYARDVSAHKKGAKWELVRIALIKRDPIAKVNMRVFDNTHAAAWRDRRSQSVSGASVNREKNLLSHICEVSIKEWKWLKVNPFKGVKMPPRGEDRKRVISADERIKLGEKATTEIYKEVLRAADFATETGMRANELLQLEPHNIVGKVAVVEDNWTPREGGKSTKGGYSREVPMSQRALEIWGGRPFNLTSRQLDIHWRNLVKLAGIDDLQFRDTRATAATRLSKIINPFQLAKMFGWKDLKQAMTYYRESASDVAKLL